MESTTTVEETQPTQKNSEEIILGEAPKTENVSVKKERPKREKKKSTATKKTVTQKVKKDTTKNSTHTVKKINKKNNKQTETNKKLKKESTKNKPAETGKTVKNINKEKNIKNKPTETKKKVQNVVEKTYITFENKKVLVGGPKYKILIKEGKIPLPENLILTDKGRIVQKKEKKVKETKPKLKKEKNTEPQLPKPKPTRKFVMTKNTIANASKEDILQYLSLHVEVAELRKFTKKMIIEKNKNKKNLKVEKKELKE